MSRSLTPCRRAEEWISTHEYRTTESRRPGRTSVIPWRETWADLRRASSSVDRFTERMLWVGKRRASCWLPSRKVSLGRNYPDAWSRHEASRSSFASTSPTTDIAWLSTITTSASAPTTPPPSAMQSRTAARTGSSPSESLQADSGSRSRPESAQGRPASACNGRSVADRLAATRHRWTSTRTDLQRRASIVRTHGTPRFAVACSHHRAGGDLGERSSVTSSNALSSDDRRLASAINASITDGTADATNWPRCSPGRRSGCENARPAVASAGQGVDLGVRHLVEGLGELEHA